MAKKETFVEYQGRLRALGVTFLGEGAFGTVYQHPTKPKVAVKVVRADMLYRRYVEFCMTQRGNPWLPVVYAITPLQLKDAPRAYSVFMERLIPCYRGQITELRTALCNKFGLTIWTQDQWFSKEGWQLIAERGDDEFSPLAKYFAANINRVDLKAGNFLRRNDQLVVTDPVA